MLSRLCSSSPEIHDYRVIDPSIDENGGLTVVLTWVPRSERDWIQILGRTGRQDHAGQYAVILNASDEEVEDGLESQKPEESLEEAMLRNGDEDTAYKFQTACEEISKVRLMHRLTSRYWTLHKADKTSTKQNWDWKTLCKEFLEMAEDEIIQQFKAVFPGEYAVADAPSEVPVKTPVEASAAVRQVALQEAEAARQVALQAASLRAASGVAPQVAPQVAPPSSKQAFAPPLRTPHIVHLGSADEVDLDFFEPATASSSTPHKLVSPESMSPSSPPGGDSPSFTKMSL